MIYEGNFQSGAYHGQGTSYYDSGIKKYEGEILYGPGSREKVFGMLLPEENSSKDSLPGIIFSMNLFWVFAGRCGSDVERDTHCLLQRGRDQFSL